MWQSIKSNAAQSARWQRCYFGVTLYCTYRMSGCAHFDRTKSYRHLKEKSMYANSLLANFEVSLVSTNQSPNSFVSKYVHGLWTDLADSTDSPWIQGPPVNGLT